MSRAIRSGSDFRRVAARGTRARRDGLTVIALRRDDRGPARLGLSVGTKVGKAVMRNRIRRRVRHAFWGYAPAEGFDVVVRATPDAAGRPFAELRVDLEAALEAAGVAGGVR